MAVQDKDNYLHRTHLHPLMFDLDSLDKLDSLSLSLVQFHLDNDEPGFEQTLHRARQEWNGRRQRARQSHQRFEGEQDALPLRPSTNDNNSSPQVPWLFVPLVETLREAHKGHRNLLRAQIGSELRKAFPDVYRRDERFSSFKLYAAEAQRLGIVRLKPGDVSGRDSIELTERVGPVFLPFYRLFRY
jgi:hypothetical protein